MGGLTATARPRTAVARYPLGFDNAAMIVDDQDRPGSSWKCTVHRDDDGSLAGEGDGASEAFVDILRHTVTVPAEGFRVVRLVPPPEATGERAAGSEPGTSTVVVGERVVVTWFHRLRNVENAAPVNHAHLAELDFLGVPVTHGILTWRSADGREIPCAVATGYLPRSRDGRVWCSDLIEQRIGARESLSAFDAAGLGPFTGSLSLPDSWVTDFPRRIGRLVGKLHVALATPSPVLPEPAGQVGASTVRSWHTTALERWNRLDQALATGSIPDDTGEWRARLPELRARIDVLDEIAGQELSPVCVQRIHGDLALDRLVRWQGGLMVDLHDGGPDETMPGTEGDRLTQPAARDLARLLVSLEDTAHLVDVHTDPSLRSAVDDWVRQARTELVGAYRKELVHAELPCLFDDRLLPAFEAEERCRLLLNTASDRTIEI